MGEIRLDEPKSLAVNYDGSDRDVPGWSAPKMTWWTAIIVALIYTAPPSFLAYLAWRQGRRTHVEFNSRFTKMLKMNSTSSFARGKLRGRAEEKKRASRR